MASREAWRSRSASPPLSREKKTISIGMMASKARREGEPCYELALAKCPSATTNPTTGLPFSRHKIKEVLTTDCYDRTSSVPWRFAYGASRRPLLQTAMDERASWARCLLRHREDAVWFKRHCVWIDIYSRVIPGGPQKATDQAAAEKNKRNRLFSRDAADESQNLGSLGTAEKQRGFKDVENSYLVAFARGVLGVHCLTDIKCFPGEKPRGAGMCVDWLPALLCKMLGRGAAKPRTIISDRGPGLFHRYWGTITSDCEARSNATAS